MQRKQIKKLVMNLVESIAALYEEKDDEKELAAESTEAGDDQPTKVTPDDGNSDIETESNGNSEYQVAVSLFEVFYDNLAKNWSDCLLQKDDLEDAFFDGFSGNKENFDSNYAFEDDMEYAEIAYENGENAKKVWEQNGKDTEKTKEILSSDLTESTDTEKCNEAKQPVWFVYLNEVDSGTGDAIDALSDIISKYNYEIADGIEDDVYGWIEQYIKDENALQHFIGVTADPDQYPAIMFDDESAAYAVADVVSSESNTIVDDWVGTSYP